MVKKLLFVMRRPPHAGVRLRESLEMILTAAAFDQSVGLLFLDDGVYQLMRGQHPEAAGLPPVAAMFEALELYDVETALVENESLTERGLNPGDLLIPTRGCDRSAIAGLLAAQDIVVAC